MNDLQKTQTTRNRPVLNMGKKLILSAAILAGLVFTSCKNDTKTDNTVEPETSEMTQEMAMKNLSFGVRGNCGMCKSTIEKAANSVEGVASANWDVDKKKMDVSFDDTKTNAMAIHQAIAASGYDTEKVAGSKEAYKNLPACCQYDHSMMMHQSGNMHSENHINQSH
ncbi:heavy-metal-associated domain-containing protein [Bizionia sediminis]|uniref:Heavy-metal-associated domain-containing protein n=1 Tax=Bizionia sediminis TaxID=1737064 RepID=A0ABW5KUY3_9FLAO